jgi:hypothetical protein
MCSINKPDSGLLHFLIRLDDRGLDRSFYPVSSLDDLVYQFRKTPSSAWVN